MVVMGARPNFVKVARLGRVADANGRLRVSFVHTGQQTDRRMTDVFMEQFGIRVDHHLSIPAGTQLGQLSSVLAGLDRLFAQQRPDGVMVVGDVTSTLGGALAANKASLPLFHLEAGLRSGDRAMPEELNRILTDRITDHFFVTEAAGRSNLEREGVAADRIHFVGNTMIDTLVAFDERIRNDDVLDRMNWGIGGHVLITLHRPATVDDPLRADKAIDMIEAVAARRRAILPLHPRTERNLERSGHIDRLRSIKGLHLAPPLDYFAFQRVLMTASAVLTDSGGVQEETTFRGVPCLTLRDNTERPVTIRIGTNQLAALDKDVVNAHLDAIFAGVRKEARIPELWEGHATERVVDILERVL